MITGDELARAIGKSLDARRPRQPKNCVDYTFADNVCIDGWYNLERAAKLLNRLERMRARLDPNWV